MELWSFRRKRPEREAPDQTEARIGQYVTALLGDKPCHEATTPHGRYILWQEEPDVVIDRHDPNTGRLIQQWRFGSIVLRGRAEPVLGVTRILDEALPGIPATDLTIFQRQLEGCFGPDLMAAGVYRA